MTLALDWTVWPGSRRGQGRVDVTLAVCDRRAGATDPDEFWDDLADLLQIQGNLYEFEALTASDTRHRLCGLHPSSVVELTRRVEPLVRPSRAAGFGAEPGTVATVGAICLWPSTAGQGPARQDLAAALLAQDAPISVRYLLRSTEVGKEEAAAIHQRAETLRDCKSPLAEPAYRSMMAIARSQPAIELRVLVGSPQRVRPGCLAAIGFAISPPASAASTTQSLVGGFTIERDEDASRERRRAFEDLDVTAGNDDRVRRLFDVWQAAAAARPPVAADSTFAGIDVGIAPLGTASNQLTTREGVTIGVALSGSRVTLPAEDRLRHSYVLGQTGTGKSTLLLSMIVQDLEAGRGVCVVDPHGDLVEAALGLIPEPRWDEVVIIEPTDFEAVVGLNVLQAEHPLQQEYLVAELCAWMYALFDPAKQGIVGPRFESMLRYASLLLMQDSQAWSFMEIPRIFSDGGFRMALLERCEDPLVAEYFETDLGSRRSSDYGELVAWFKSKFEPFRTVPSVRRMLGQRASTFSFADTMDSGGIVLANLSKGLLGDYNSRLLGFVVFARLWAAALTRAGRGPAERRPFYVYVDEAQTITTSSLPTILSEARKYGIAATLANQFFDQVPPDLRASILGNVGTKLAFRMGAPDAVAFAHHHGADFDAHTLRRLPNFEVVADLLVGGEPVEPQHLRTASVVRPAHAAERAEEVRRRSRARFGVPVLEIDREFRARYEAASVPPRQPDDFAFLFDGKPG